MRRQTSFPRARRNRIAGMTLLELILTCGILLVLSAAAIPMFRITIQHRKESELRYDLREMRNAIDRYKDDADKNLIRTEVGSQNYPPDLQTLVDGVTMSAGGGGAGGISASALAGASNTASLDPPGRRNWERDRQAGRHNSARARRAAFRPSGQPAAPAKPCRTHPARCATCEKFRWTR